MSGTDVKAARVVEPFWKIE